MSFHQRLIAEKAELDERLTKLEAFKETPQFLTIDPKQQSLLKLQSSVMLTLSLILAERLALLEPQA